MGEVTLVVVGILIALQVNNWNEGRKEDRLAAAYTAGVAADLDRDALYYHTAVAYQYPLGGAGFFGEGPLSELLWEGIEPAELAVRFQQLAGLKRVKVFWEEIVLEDVLDQVNLIRDRLPTDA